MGQTLRTLDQALCELDRVRALARQLPELGTKGAKEFTRQTSLFCARCSDEVCHRLASHPDVPAAFRSQIAMRLQGVWVPPAA